MTEKEIKLLKTAMDSTQEIMRVVMGDIPAYTWDDEILSTAYYALNTAYLHLCTDIEGMKP